MSGCGSGLETALMRLDGVAVAAGKSSKKMFALVYKPDASFQPKAIRDAVAELGVEVVRFHIVARGKTLSEGDKLYFLAGKDRFLVVDPPKMPADVPIGIAGVVDDSASPLQLKIDDFKELE